MNKESYEEKPENSIPYLKCMTPCNLQHGGFCEVNDYKCDRLKPPSVLNKTEEKGTLWFHGTIRKYAKQIRKNGFSKGTYFTKYFDSAFGMGGPYVFAVYFKKDPTKYWEYITPTKISPKRISSLRFISVDLMYYSQDISRQLRKDSHPGIHCNKCDGFGELKYINNGHHLLPRGCSFKRRRKITVCPDCNGYGYLPGIVALPAYQNRQ